jgi:flagellar biosynthesis GTPase FlhF
MVQQFLHDVKRKLWSSTSDLEPPRFTDRSILIAVMGMTGAGKTTFISKTTGLDMEIGHGLRSCRYNVSS